MEGLIRTRKKKIYGIGINDNPYPDMYDNCYNLWHRMLRRCYSEKVISVRPTYKGCSVCDEWLTLSNFRKWFEDPANGYREGYHLDKDILVKGNQAYSPDTCCFVPKEINSILTNRKRFRGQYPIGVYKNDSSYIAVVNKYGRRFHIGSFPTLESAFIAYKSAKEAYIQELAQEYYDRDEITKKVYDALMRYEVEITD